MLAAVTVVPGKQMPSKGTAKGKGTSGELSGFVAGLAEPEP